MNVQVITRDGEPEYAVLPWAEYQKLVQAAQLAEPAEIAPEKQPVSWQELPKLREQAGFTLESFARELGISPSYWQMIESGEREASEVVLRNICRLLKVDGIQ